MGLGLVAITAATLLFLLVHANALLLPAAAPAAPAARLAAVSRGVQQVQRMQGMKMSASGHGEPRLKVGVSPTPFAMSKKAAKRGAALVLSTGLIMLPSAARAATRALTRDVYGDVLGERR
jgi:hypothetical protein